MKLNRAQKVGAFIGGASGIFFGLWGNYVLDEYLDEQNYDLENEISNLSSSLKATPLLMLSIATGSYLGLATGSAVSLTQRGSGAFMNNVNNQLFSLFKNPCRKDAIAQLKDNSLYERKSDIGKHV